ncbi:peptide ABC transporter [Sinirhodobacter ferrireducens]|uniref:Peptide ABC transporter n=1 Tax=Paenirhodobacter ferrireducens TaxID=1215032 RepID=A0A443LHU9_9RHOB|nr:M55 family metallopeptidase [Sinirhodobacter ferrireducens]RWR48693.1 peptide ABC transporter [Sinirhodobacter ferrireducens]
MKVFISADMEGTAGITTWSETEKDHPDYAEFRAYMTEEVLAACEGARAAGAEEVVVKDAHSSGRNLIIGRLPAYVRILRSWSGHPDTMMFGIGAEFDAAIYTGYHNRAGAETNPLSHTLTDQIMRITINGEPASEFTINARTAARYGVPSVFLSGDAGMCRAAGEFVPGIATVATSEGIGGATLSIPPAKSAALIREGVERAVAARRPGMMPPMPDSYELVIEYNNPKGAYRCQWFPGGELCGERSVRWRFSDPFEIQRTLRFVSGG